MAKRAPAATPKNSGGGGQSPLLSAVAIMAALGYGGVLLVQNGRLSWPPYNLLGSMFTVFGCIALVGPFILCRRAPGDAYLGELVWLTCGLLIWMHDLAFVARGDWKTAPWATPMSYQAIGLAALAIVIAGRQCGIAAKSWAWTNVVGLILALFWVGMGVWTVGTAATSRVATSARGPGLLDGPR